MLVGSFLIDAPELVLGKQAYIRTYIQIDNEKQTSVMYTHTYIHIDNEKQTSVIYTHTYRHRGFLPSLLSA
jgi:hypothetical protein